MSQAINKYIQNHSEPECTLLDSFPQNSFKHCLVIPCFDEAVHFIDTLQQSFKHVDNVLVIIVVNQPSTYSTIIKNNLELLQSFSQKFHHQWTQDHLSLYQTKNTALHWLVVDRSNKGLTLPPKQGVGLARKIGCDLGVTLYNKGLLKCTWIHCTDADTKLPSNYFQLPHIPTKAPLTYSAAVYSFTHCRSPNESEEIYQATKLYEQALNYYVAGLTWAGSLYAFPTIGSTLALNIRAYCQVRGFPKRAAGEDFYLLNKLRKLAPILNVKDITLTIQTRLSHRVPFGTGPAVEKILALTIPETEYTYYSPKTFTALKQWLNIIPNVWLSLQNDLNPIAELPVHIQSALKQAHIHKLWAHINKQVKDKNACTNAIHNWFDAFQTLKFIRRLQESTYPAIPLKNGLKEMSFNLETVDKHQQYVQAIDIHRKS